MSLVIRVEGVGDSQTETRRLNCFATFKPAKSPRWLHQPKFLYVIFNITSNSSISHH